MSQMKPEGHGPDAGEAHPGRDKPGYLKQSRELLDMIKFEHTVFALPFALLGAMTGAQGMPPWRTVLWILLAMVGARTAAMTFNRLVDADIDAENPRTAQRAIPTGRVSRGVAMAFLGLSIVLFGFSAGMLGPLPWVLSPLALFIILGYSLCKRFTAWAHVVLGLSLAGAPLGAWIAVTGRFELAPCFLALGVLAWTAGFDVLYALQDEAFDRAKGLCSIPSRLGLGKALLISRGLHIVALGAWAAFNAWQGAHFLPWLGWATVAVILVREQWVVRGGRLDRIDHAFFTLNSMVGALFFLGHLFEFIAGVLF